MTYHIGGDIVAGALIGAIGFAAKQTPRDNIIASAFAGSVGVLVESAINKEFSAAYMASSVLTTTAASMATYYLLHGISTHYEPAHKQIHVIHHDAPSWADRTGCAAPGARAH